MRWALVIICLGSLFGTLALVNSWDQQWLSANQANEGVVVLPSGLQYKIIRSAPPGGPKLRWRQKCRCSYSGTLLDGTVFAASSPQGEVISPSRVIAGWAEALQLMSAGDRWMLYVPAKLGYGPGQWAQRPPDAFAVPSGATLTYDVELLEVEAGSYLTRILNFRTQIDRLDLLLMGVDALLAGGAIVGLYVLYSCVRGGGSSDRLASACHILVGRDEADFAAVLKAQLDACQPDEVAAKFSDLAQQHSICPSGQRGGSLGSFGPGQIMVPAFDRACWAAPLGVVQGPIATEFGHHLILVTDRSRGKQKGD